MFDNSINDDRLSLLRCIRCENGQIIRSNSNFLKCTECSESYEITSEGIICMVSDIGMPEHDIYNDPDYLKWQEINADVVSDYVEKDNMLFFMIYHSAHLKISNWLNKNNHKWILDIGCGQGIHYQYYNHYDNIIGIDLNIVSLRVLKRKYPQAFLVQGNILDMPFKNQAFDAMHSIYNLEHIYYLDETLDEIKRILARNGSFFVGLPSEGGIPWNLGRYLTTARQISKEHNIDYKKVMKIEHCNTADKVIKALNQKFNIRRKMFFPFNFLPSNLVNITVSLEAVKNS